MSDYEGIYKGPSDPLPDVTAVVELRAALARVERERDDWAKAAQYDAGLREAVAEVAALRAQMEALTKAMREIRDVAREQWMRPQGHEEYGDIASMAEAALAAAKGQEEPWCTCGAKTPQGEYHDVGCPAREIDD